MVPIIKNIEEKIINDNVEKHKESKMSLEKEIIDV